MRRIILIIIASIMFANIGFAEMKLIEEKSLKGEGTYKMATVCVDGYKFVITGISASSRNMVQFYEQVRGRGPGIGLQPAKC